MLLEELLAGEGFEVSRRVVPDERAAIAEAIEELARESRVVLTTGGTGVGPAGRDARGDCVGARALRSRESPRRSAPTRSRRLRTACSGVAWRACSARRSSSTCPARPAASATGSLSCSLPSSTRCTSSRAKRPRTARHDQGTRAPEALRGQARASGPRPGRAAGRVPARHGAERRWQDDASQAPGGPRCAERRRARGRRSNAARSASSPTSRSSTAS